MDDKSLDTQLSTHKVCQLKHMHKYHYHHAVLHKLYMWFRKSEFRLLKQNKNVFVWGAAAPPSKYAHATNTLFVWLS